MSLHLDRAGGLVQALASIASSVRVPPTRGQVKLHLSVGEFAAGSGGAQAGARCRGRSELTPTLGTICCACVGAELCTEGSRRDRSGQGDTTQRSVRPGRAQQGAAGGTAASTHMEGAPGREVPKEELQEPRRSQAGRWGGHPSFAILGRAQSRVTEGRERLHLLRYCAWELCGGVTGSSPD